jgi:TP901 family phage tail tape measure protein
MGVNLGSAYGSIEIGTEGAEKNISSLSKQLSQTGQAMTLGITAPLVGIAAAAVHSAAGFEQSLNIMAQVSGATTEQMAALQAQALEMGAVTSFSAGEAAEAQLELAKAGMAPLEVMDALPGVLDAAAAGGMGLAESATLVSGALNAFGLDASESANVANQLAAAANASAADMSDLGAGLQQGGFAFAAAGQNLDDLNASIAILTNVGLGGSDAGTALKNAMMQLMNPTKKAAKEMKALGINVYDTQGKMLPWADVIDQFDRATENLTDAERNAALGTILLGDGMKAMVPLLDQGKEGFLEMKEAVNKEGSAAETANARMQGMNGAIEYLMGSIDSFLIGAALPFLDSFSGIIRVVADGITAIGALPEPLRNAALAFAAVLAAAGPVMMAIPAIGAAFAALTSPIALVVVAIAGLAAAWTMNLGGIQDITMRLLAPLGALWNAFANLAGVLADAGAGSIEAQEAISLFPEALQPVISGALGLWIAFNNLAEVLADAGAGSIEAEEALSLFPETLQPIIGGAVQLWLAFTNLTEVLADAGAGSIEAQEAISLFPETLQPIIGGAVQLWFAFTNIVEVLADAGAGSIEAQEAISLFPETLQPVITGALALWVQLSALGGTFQNLVTVLADAGAGSIEAQEAISLFPGVLQPVISAALQLWIQGNALAVTLQSMLAPAFAAVISGAQQLPALLAGLPATFQAIATNAAALWAQFMAVATMIVAFFAPSFARVGEAFAGLPVALAPLLPKLAELGAAFGGLVTSLQPFIALIGGVLAVAAAFGVNAFAAVIERLPQIVGPIIDQVTAAFRLISTVLTEVWAAVKAAIDGDWTTVWASAKTVFQEFATFFRGTIVRFSKLTATVFGAVYDAVVNTLTDLGIDITPLLDGIKATWETVWTAVKNALTPVTDAVTAVQTAVQNFSNWLGGLTLPNPFAPLADAAGAVNAALGFGGGEEPKAGGSSYAGGGLTMVGERGPEAVVMPAGSRVLTNGQTNNLQGSSGTTINVNFSGVKIGRDMDLQQIGYGLANQIAAALG